MPTDIPANVAAGGDTDTAPYFSNTFAGTSSGNGQHIELFQKSENSTNEGISKRPPPRQKWPVKIGTLRTGLERI